MPKWLKKAVFYQIYPQSYNDTNGDGIGDIQGIIDKLDYIKETGFDAIWLNPWYDSPFLDAGYDIADFYKVAPRYGTNDDAKRLFEAAHQRGLKIVLDLVIGHTSLTSPWFLKSCEGPDNEFSDMYIWSPLLCYRGDPNDGNDYYVSGWCPRGSFKANFFAVQPALNFGYNKILQPWEMPYDAPAPRRNRQEMVNIMRYWMDMGADGFRVDMASSVVKRDPGNRLTSRFWREVRKVFDRDYPQNALISEWFDPRRSLAAGFHVDFPGLDCNHFRNEDWGRGIFKPDEVVFGEDKFADPVRWVKAYLAELEPTRKKGFIGLFSGNHDVGRLTRYGGRENVAIKLAALLTLPGCPFVYYGDEIAMRYIDGLPSKEGGDVRTGSRTPMQWDCSKPNAGFSSAPADKLYLPVDSAPDAPCVAEALAGKNIVYNELKKLLKLRKEHRALDNNASVKFVYLKRNTMPLAYVRESGREKLLIVLNPTREQRDITLRCGAQNAELLLGNGVTRGEGQAFAVPPFSYGIFKL